VADELNAARSGEMLLRLPAEQPMWWSRRKSKWYRWRKDGTALIAYLLDSEVHTFAFSVAANAILSFIPFIVLLYTLAVGLSLAGDGGRGQRHGELLSALEPGVCFKRMPNLAEAASRHGVQVFADHDSDRLHGYLSASGGGAEPGLGRDQEPQLSAQSRSSPLAWRFLMVVLGHGQHSAERGVRAACSADRDLRSHTDINFFVLHFTIREPVSSCWRNHRRGLDSVLLFDLLAAAQPQGSLAAGAAHRDLYRNYLAGGQDIFCGWCCRTWI
jgi:hypothetical protein